MLRQRNMEIVTINTGILLGSVTAAYEQYKEDYATELESYLSEINSYARRMIKLAKDSNLAELAKLEPPSQPKSRAAEFERLIAALRMSSLTQVTITSDTFARCVLNYAG